MDTPQLAAAAPAVAPAVAPVADTGTDTDVDTKLDTKLDTEADCEAGNDVVADAATGAAGRAGTEAHSYPVAGIGASAGGLPALVTLLENMPPAPGVALVVVLHLSSDHPSTADRLLQRVTAMPVVQVTRTTQILPNHVYIISPGHSLAMEDGQLIVEELKRPAGDPTTINEFLFTLAETHQEHAIGIILSGMGSDGVSGLMRIKEFGGVTIVQLPGDAEEGSMPQAAIESGAADFVLPAARIPAKLLEIRDIAHVIRERGLAGRAPEEAPPFDLGAPPEDTLDSILRVLHARTGHDFAPYKRHTMLRRIERRLQVRGMRDLPAYRRLLERDRDEPAALLKDLLIGVTGFFRDRHAFAALQRLAVPRILHGLEPSAQARAWVAACATGEEAYSLGMLLAEQAAAMAPPASFQVFASDIDESAIALARTGRYPASIAADVGDERLQRHFVDEGGRYRVRKALRDRILFARHNLLQDPPFSRLDLVSCRNMLIYLTRDMYGRALELLHSSLNAGGYLFLGSAESADMAPHLFEPVDAKHHIYRAKPAAQAPRRLAMVSSRDCADGPLLARFPHGADGRPAGTASIAFVHQRALVDLAPPSVLVDGKGEVRHASDNAAQFLRYAGGEPSRDILALVLPELRLPLRATLLQAERTEQRADSGPVRHGDQMVCITVTPLPGQWEGPLQLVQFEPCPAPPARTPGTPGNDTRQLEEELDYTRQRLRQAVAEAEMRTADVHSAREEAMCTIDGLRATIERLETALEELQSRNEELHTVNAELAMRVAETDKANDDLSNLIASTDIATLFLDQELRIKRFTPHVAAVINILPADIDRPLTHLTNKLHYPNLADDVAGVLATLAPREREVHGSDGRHYIVRMHPYHTAEGHVVGAVVTFFDISRRYEAEEALRASEEQFRLFVTASSDTLYKMSADWSEMRSLQGMRFLADTDNPSRTWLQRYIPEEERQRVKPAIEHAIRHKATFELEHRVIRADGALAWVFSRAIPLLDAQGGIVEWFGAASDISERKRGEAALREREAQLAAELSSARMLQRLSVRPLWEQSPETLQEHMMDVAMALMKSDAATIQLLEPGGKRLRLVASRNLHELSREHWQLIDAGQATSCGRFLQTMQRVQIADVEADAALAGTADLEEFRRSGLRSVQSTPLTAADGRPIGLISTHWRVPFTPADETFYLFDVLVRQLADLLEQMHRVGGAS